MGRHLTGTARDHRRDVHACTVPATASAAICTTAARGPMPGDVGVVLSRTFGAG
jgi:hypothetical protein